MKQWAVPGFEPGALSSNSNTLTTESLSKTPEYTQYIICRDTLSQQQTSLNTACITLYTQVEQPQRQDLSEFETQIEEIFDRNINQKAQMGCKKSDVKKNPILSLT